MAPATWAHMPTFVGYDSCVFEDEASTQSMGIYIKVPAGKVARCSFIINDANEDLRLSLNMPISHYTTSMAKGLNVDIYAPSSPAWKPQCKVGWNGWHGGVNDDNDNKKNDVTRAPLNALVPDRTTVFEPWGVGGYVPIIGCSTPIASKGTRHFISVNNTNDREARVCIGVGTKEEHFRSFGTWIELKWSFALWRTWEWGLTRGAFATVLALAVAANLYLFALFAYGAKPQWFCWLPGMSRFLCSYGSSSDHHDRCEGVKLTRTNNMSDSDSDSDSDWELHHSEGNGCSSSSSSSSDCDDDDEMLLMMMDIDQLQDRDKSDQVVDAAGFIVLFWISGVAVVWLVIFFINCADVATGGETKGPRLIRWENMWSPVMYVYTLPVVVFTMLYILARYSRLWGWFWRWSRRRNANAVLLLLIFDIMVAIIFDMIYPFSFLSVAVCLYCLFEYVRFMRNGRRLCPTIPPSKKRNGTRGKKRGTRRNGNEHNGRQQQYERLEGGRGNQSHQKHKQSVKPNNKSKRTLIIVQQKSKVGGKHAKVASTTSASSSITRGSWSL